MDYGHESAFAPPAWAVIQEDYLLRFTGTLEPGVHLDFMEGRAPILELYNIKNDPAKTINLIEGMPEKVKKMAQIYFEGATEFIPPVV